MTAETYVTVLRHIVFPAFAKGPFQGPSYIQAQGRSLLLISVAEINEKLS